MTIAQSLLLVEALALWWLTFTGHITIGWLLILASLATLASGACSPTIAPPQPSM